MLLNALLHPKSLTTRCYHAITFNFEIEASEQSISKCFFPPISSKLRLMAEW